MVAVIFVGDSSDERESAVSNIGSSSSDKAADELEVVWKPGPDGLHCCDAAQVHVPSRYDPQDDGSCWEDQFAGYHVRDSVAETLEGAAEHYTHQDVVVRDAAAVVQSEMVGFLKVFVIIWCFILSFHVAASWHALSFFRVKFLAISNKANNIKSEK